MSEEKQMPRKLSKSGEMRAFLGECMTELKEGKLDINAAKAIQAMGQRINDNLFAEAKVREIQRAIGEPIQPLGQMAIGETGADQ